MRQIAFPSPAAGMTRVPFTDREKANAYAVEALRRGCVVYIETYPNGSCEVVSHDRKN